MLANLYSKLIKKHGENFNWMLISEKNNFFIDEIISELNQNHPLFNNIYKAVLKCESSDDVLFLLKSGGYAIVHLTYSKDNAIGFPVYKVFIDLENALNLIEESLLHESI